LIPALLISFFFFAPSARAGLIIDNHLFYASSAMKTTDNETNSRYTTSVFIGASIPKLWFIGWKSTLFADSTKDSAGEAKVSGLEMGPRAGVFLGKSRWWSFTTTYLPVHTAKHTSSAGVESKLSGSGFEFELTFAPEVFKNLSPGVSLLYHLGSYSSSTDSANTTSNVSYSRSGITPSIYLHWVFGGLD
jgi:hypothetical protein